MQRKYYRFSLNLVVFFLACDVVTSLSLPFWHIRVKFAYKDADAVSGCVNVTAFYASAYRSGESLDPPLRERSVVDSALQR